MSAADFSAMIKSAILPPDVIEAAAAESDSGSSARIVGLDRYRHLSRTSRFAVFIPSSILKGDAAVLGDMRNTSYANVFLTMLQAQTFLVLSVAEAVGVSANGVALGLDAAKHFRTTVSFWKKDERRRGASSSSSSSRGPEADIYADCPEAHTGMFAEEYAGITVYAGWVKDTPGTRVAQERVDAACKSLTEELANRLSKKHLSGKSAIRVKPDKSNLFDTVTLELMNKVAQSYAGPEFLESIPKCARDMKALFATRLANNKAVHRSGADLPAVCCEISFRSLVDMQTLDLRNVILPHVAKHLTRFELALERALPRPASDKPASSTAGERAAHRVPAPDFALPGENIRAARMRTSQHQTDSSSASGRFDVATLDADKIVTIDRELGWLFDDVSARLSAACGEDLAAKARCIGLLRELMFRLYCTLARSPDSRLSITGEALHTERIGRGADIVDERLALSSTSRSIKENLGLQSDYDSFRVTTVLNLDCAFACRKELVTIAMLLLELAPCVYSGSASMAPHTFLYGHSGQGKDFLLKDIVQRIYVDGTVVKLSRSTAHVDSVDCKGRRDDAVTFCSECATESMTARGSRGGGDRLLKDRMAGSEVTTAALHIDPRTGERTIRDIQNLRKIIQFDATNFSRSKTLDPAIKQRYVFVPLPPATESTSIQTAIAALQANKDDPAVAGTKRLLRFLQIVTYEVNKMMMCGAMADVTDDAAIVTLLYVWQSIYRDRDRYGCSTPVFRKLDKVLQLARTHSIRRVIVNTFLSSEGRWFAKRATPARLRELKYVIKLQDVVTALGQMAEYIGVFTHGELQLIMALRYLWILSPTRTEMFAPALSGGRGTFSPCYVRFPGRVSGIADRCAKAMHVICATEPNAPAPKAASLLADCLKSLNNPPEGSGKFAPTVSAAENRLRFLKPLRDSRGYLQSLYPTIAQESELESTTKRGLTPESPGGAASKEFRVPAILERDGFFDVHVAYLSRLFDPQHEFWPWTAKLPRSWSPVVDEHTLISGYLQNLRGFAGQTNLRNSFRMLYRMWYPASEDRVLPEETSEVGGRHHKSRPMFTLIYTPTEKSSLALRVPLTESSHRAPLAIEEDLEDDSRDLSAGGGASSSSSQSPPRLQSAEPDERESCHVYAPLDDIALRARELGSWNKAVKEFNTEPRRDVKDASDDDTDAEDETQDGEDDDVFILRVIAKPEKDRKRRTRPGSRTRRRKRQALPAVLLE